MSGEIIQIQVEKVLTDLDFHFEVEEEQIVDFSVGMDHLDVSVRLFCDDDRIIAFTDSSIRIPKERHFSVLAEINHIHNESLRNAHIFINVENHHLMAQAVMYLEEMDEFPTATFKSFLGDVCWIIDNHYKEIMRVVVCLDKEELVKQFPTN